MFSPRGKEDKPKIVHMRVIRLNCSPAGSSELGPSGLATTHLPHDNILGE